MGFFHFPFPVGVTVGVKGVKSWVLKNSLCVGGGLNLNFATKKHWRHTFRGEGAGPCTSCANILFQNFLNKPETSCHTNHDIHVIAYAQPMPTQQVQRGWSSRCDRVTHPSVTGWHTTLTCMSYPRGEQGCMHKVYHETMGQCMQ